MATYLERFELASNENFRKKTAMAARIRAVELSKTGTNGERAWAARVLRQGLTGAELDYLTILLTANPAVGSAGEAAPDGDIQFVVNATIPELVLIG